MSELRVRALANRVATSIALVGGQAACWAIEARGAGVVVPIVGATHAAVSEHPLLLAAGQQAANKQGDSAGQGTIAPH
jgi:hypothetical protein